VERFTALKKIFACPGATERGRVQPAFLGAPCVLCGSILSKKERKVREEPNLRIACAQLEPGRSNSLLFGDLVGFPRVQGFVLLAAAAGPVDDDAFNGVLLAEAEGDRQL